MSLKIQSFADEEGVLVRLAADKVGRHFSSILEYKKVNGAFLEDID